MLENRAGSLARSPRTERLLWYYRSFQVFLAIHISLPELHMVVPTDSAISGTKIKYIPLSALAGKDYSVSSTSIIYVDARQALLYLLL